MIGADTNIALRLILQDDETQLALIESVMVDQRLFFPLTALMETGWVLASRYQLDRNTIADALMAFLALDRVEVARAELVGWAIERFRAGADWADMIHLAASRKVGGFLTLDRKLVQQAGERPPVPIETLR